MNNSVYPHYKKKNSKSSDIRWSECLACWLEKWLLWWIDCEKTGAKANTFLEPWLTQEMKTFFAMIFADNDFVLVQWRCLKSSAIVRRRNIVCLLNSRGKGQQQKKQFNKRRHHLIAYHLHLWIFWRNTDLILRKQEKMPTTNVNCLLIVNNPPEPKNINLKKKGRNTKNSHKSEAGCILFNEQLLPFGYVEGTQKI